MKEIFGDLFEQIDADVICITTNSTRKKNGDAVMGCGCASEADRRWKLAKFYGIYCKRYSDSPFLLKKTKDYSVVAFPVKFHWKEKANINLIMKVAALLVFMSTNNNWKKIVIPRPGCGAGGLDWETEVKPVLENILDDRFYIITNEKKRNDKTII